MCTKWNLLILVDWLTNTKINCGVATISCFVEACLPSTSLTSDSGVRALAVNHKNCDGTGSGHCDKDKLDFPVAYPKYQLT